MGLLRRWIAFLRCQCVKKEVESGRQKMYIFFSWQFFFSLLSNSEIISGSWKLGTKVYYLKHFLRDISPHLSQISLQKSMSPNSSIKKHAGKSKIYTFNFSKSIKDAVLHQLALKASFLPLKLSLIPQSYFQLFFLGTTWPKSKLNFKATENCHLYKNVA